MSEAINRREPFTAADRAPMNVSQVRVRMYHTDFVGGVFHGRYFAFFNTRRGRPVGVPASVKDAVFACEGLYRPD